MHTPDQPFNLTRWRREISELYASVRRTPDSEQALAWGNFKAKRNTMFRDYPNTPLKPEDLPGFKALNYYPYDPAWRVVGRFSQQVQQETFEIELNADGIFVYTRVGKVCFEITGIMAELSVYWVEGYGGGIFLPFRDKTNGRDTYGGGRYLYDTIKGADLGVGPEEMILDFNYAYNPSCAYCDRWVCPLPPRENSLDFAVEAGEKSFDGNG